MPKSFPSRHDTGLMVAVVVAAVVAGMSTRQTDPARHTESETSTSEESQFAQHRSPLVDYLNAVGVANDAADPSAMTIAARLAP